VMAWTRGGVPPRSAAEMARKNPICFFNHLCLGVIAGHTERLVEASWPDLVLQQFLTWAD